jgi:hypothetical protein
VLGKEWVATVLEFQKKVHRVSVIILKALFIALGRDETIVEEVSLPPPQTASQQVLLVEQESQSMYQTSSRSSQSCSNLHYRFTVLSN